jgi:cytochrome c oxidase assembly protein subunit 15
VLPASADGFARLTTLLAAAMWLNVASGAWVRVTGSGLGCPDWPGCHGRPYPPQSYHSLIEFSNRVIAVCGIAIAIAAWIAAKRTADRTARWLAGGIALGSLGQAPLGALTVHFHLNPLLVMSHFLLAVVLLGLAAVLAARSRPATAGGTRPTWLAWLAVAAVVAGFGLIVSGAFSTAAGPHSGGSNIPRLGNLVDATYVHVRVATAYAITIVALLGALAFGGFRPSGWRPLAIALLVLLPAQAFVGEWQWHHGLPRGFVLAHVAIAAAAWIVTVALATLVLRRRPGPARPPTGRPAGQATSG